MEQHKVTLGLGMHLTQLRSDAMQAKYENDVRTGETGYLELAPAIKIYDHWRIIEAMYPYDAVFSVHHLLVPKMTGRPRQLAELDRQQMDELVDLIDLDLSRQYDVVLLNSMKQRSFTHIFHFNLGVYHRRRRPWDAR